MRIESLFFISSLKLLKMFDERNIGFATGSTLVRRLDEVATQPKVTIGTIGNYRGLLENTRELLLTTWEEFGTTRTYWEIGGYLGTIGDYQGSIGEYQGMIGDF